MSKTESLPGMGPKKVKEIEQAAEDYVKKRNSRMAMLKLEVEAKKTLSDLMHEHQLATYEYETEDDDQETIERVVEIKSKENIRVKAKDNCSDGEDEEEESED